MAFDHIIMTDQRIVFSLAWDTLTFADVINHRTRLAEDSRFSVDFRQILDLTRVTAIELSSDKIMSLAQQRVFASESRRAMVAAASLNYGLGRMFQAYSEAQNVSIFRELNEAVEWVGVPIEVANRAFSDLCVAHDLA